MTPTGYIPDAPFEMLLCACVFCIYKMTTRLLSSRCFNVWCCDFAMYLRVIPSSDLIQLRALVWSRRTVAALLEPSSRSTAAALSSGTLVFMTGMRWLHCWKGRRAAAIPVGKNEVEAPCVWVSGSSFSGDTRFAIYVAIGSLTALHVCPVPRKQSTLVHPHKGATTHRWSSGSVSEWVTCLQVICTVPIGLSLCIVSSVCASVTTRFFCDVPSNVHGLTVGDKVTCTSFLWSCLAV